MGTTNVRLYVSDLYPSEKWKRKVAAMPDRQVYAIYRRTEEAKAKKLYFPESKPDTPWPIYETTKQYSIFDL